MENMVPGLVVNQAVVAQHVDQELPFMATENLMMAAVRAGGDRQELHEHIRKHSLAARKQMVEQGLPNDLPQRLSTDPNFSGVDLGAVLQPANFVGRSPEQVHDFLNREVEPIRKKYPELLGQSRDVHV